VPQYPLDRGNAATREDVLRIRWPVLRAWLDENLVEQKTSGRFEAEGQKIFFEIDYFDRTLT